MTRKPQDQLFIPTYEGNTLYFQVNVKRFGVRGNTDVSGAAQITVEWENSAGEHQAQIICADDDPGADWANGVIAIPVTPANFTAAVGTYTFSLTLNIDNQIVTTDTGTVEVRERPGFPLPA